MPKKNKFQQDKIKTEVNAEEEKKDAQKKSLKLPPGKDEKWWGKFRV